MDVGIIFIVIFIFVHNIYGDTTISPDIKSIIRSTLALRVLGSTLNSTKNMVIATLPLEFQFCKLASVAKPGSQAKEELVKAMGFHKEAMVNDFYSYFKEGLNELQNGDLTYINRIYVNYSSDVSKNFAKDSIEQYGVHVDSVSYNLPKAAVNFINEGIASITLRRVEDVLKLGDINKLSSLLLITAGHFKPTWPEGENFDPSLTTTRPFQLLNHTRVDMPMMSRVGNYHYYDAKDYRVISLRLWNREWRLTFVQPEFIPLDRVLRLLASNPDIMNSIRKQMKWTIMNFVMPRMKIKSQVDLDEFLQNVGIKEIFNNKSTDLNAILKEGVKSSNMSVTKVTQKLFMEVDEFGLSRVYDRLLQRNNPRYSPTGMPEVALDRPFYFKLEYEAEMDALFDVFHGVYYGPQ